MSKNKFFRFFVGLFLLGMTACISESLEDCPTTEPGAPVPIKFAAKSAAQTRTANAGTDWVTGDTIGIYMMPGGGTIDLNTADNRTFKAAGDGGTSNTPVDFTATSLNQTLYYPTNAGDPLKFIAYYPYRPTASAAALAAATTPALMKTDYVYAAAGSPTTYTYKIDVGNQSDTTKIDALWAMLDGHKYGDSPKATLPFKHTLSRLVINIKGQAGSDVYIPGTIAQAANVPSTGWLDLGTGDVTASTDLSYLSLVEVSTTDDQRTTQRSDLPDGNGGVKSGLDTFAMTFQAIFLPHLVDQDALATTDVIHFFTGGGRQFDFNLNKAEIKSSSPVATLTEFESAKSYTIWLEFQGEKVVQIDGYITPWDNTDYQLEFTTAAGAGAKSKYFLPNKLDTLDVVYIPKGTATIGDNSTYATAHTVTINPGFRMGRTPVTIAQYLRFLNDMGADVNGSGTVYARLDTGSAKFKEVFGSYAPTETWKTYINGGGGSNQYVYLIYAGTNDVPVTYSSSKWSKGSTTWSDDQPAFNVCWAGAKLYALWAGGDLPTEAEWEYAARGNTPDNIPFIDGTTDGGSMGNFAWYNHTGSPYGNTVNSTRTAHGGLLDMFGNVEEYLLDKVKASTDYDLNTTLNPVDNTGVYYATRGGSFKTTAVADLRISARSVVRTTNSSNNWIGFRIVVR